MITDPPDTSQDDQSEGSTRSEHVLALRVLDRVPEEIAGLGARQGVGLDQARRPPVVEVDEEASQLHRAPRSSYRMQAPCLADPTPYAAATFSRQLADDCPNRLTRASRCPSQCAICVPFCAGRVFLASRLTRPPLPSGQKYLQTMRCGLRLSQPQRTTETGLIIRSDAVFG
jgi:hypothetical protein